MDTDDIFEPIHQFVFNCVQKGHQDGVRDGMVAGIEDGRELGSQKGYEIGIEVGFYAGCVRTWRQLQTMDQRRQPKASLHPSRPVASDRASASTDQPASDAQSTSTSQPGTLVSSETNQCSMCLFIPERAERGLVVLEELLAAFPLNSPQDEALHDLLERLRGRFKATASMMGLLTDYFPRESADEEHGAGGGSLTF